MLLFIPILSKVFRTSSKHPPSVPSYPAISIAGNPEVFLDKYDKVSTLHASLDVCSKTANNAIIELIVQHVFF